MISSLQNPTIRRAARLRKPIRREQDQAFIVEGHQALSVALAVHAPLIEVFHTRGAARRRSPLIKETTAAGARVHEVADDVMAYLTSHAHPPDVCATTPLRRSDLGRAAAGDLVVVLVGVRDPSVVGAVMASAAVASASGVVATHGTADPFAPACVRAGCGAHFVLDVAAGVAPLEAAGALAGRRLLLLDDEGIDPARAGAVRPLAVVVVGPADPVPEAFRSAERVCIPGGPAGVRAGIGARAAVLLYEVGRQVS